MRLLLKLSALETREFPFNYNYSFSAAIYKMLHFGSAEFAGFLHNFGYNIDGKFYKLFTFALRFEKAIPNIDAFELLSPNIDLYISSPLIDEFISNFVLGTINNQIIEIVSDHRKTELRIISIEILPEPNFTETMRFFLLSPIILSTKITFKDHLSTYYLRYDDNINEINRILTQNLTNKYSVINNNDKKTSFNQLSLEWDQNYIYGKAGLKKKLTTKTTIDKIDRKIDVIGNMLPFTLKGDPELIRAGYICGFGEKNAMGFGLAEILKS